MTRPGGQTSVNVRALMGLSTRRDLGGMRRVCGLIDDRGDCKSMSGASSRWVMSED